MITKRIKKTFLGITISILCILIIHYFLISKINVDSTIQVFVDFIIFWIIFGIIIKMLGVTKRRKNKTGLRYCLVFLIIIPVLIIHYFLISKINIDSTIQVFVDFIIFWVILTILTQIKIVDKWMENKKK